MVMTSAEADWPGWSIEQVPAGLGRYVVPDAVAMYAAVPAGSGEAVGTRLREVWHVLQGKRIGYAYEPPDGEERVQRIRPPSEVLDAPRSGTCLDLALVLSGACEHAGLRSAVILLEPAGGGTGHALVAVALSSRWPLAETLTAMPEGLIDRVAESLSGPPRDLAVLDPSGMAISLGATATAGLDTDLETAVAAGRALLCDERWGWRLATPPAAPAECHRPMTTPAVPPLREIYQRPEAAGSALALVRAEYALTPFQPRDEMLVADDFVRRVAVGHRTGLLIVHGTGGSGKTRLGLELAERFRKEGWHAGPLREFATEDEQPHRSASLAWLARVTAPLLVMVDYADAHAADLITLLAVLKRRTENSGSPAVVIATARSVTGDWLTDVTDALGTDMHPHLLELFELDGVHPQPRRVYERTAENMWPRSTNGLPPLPSPRAGHAWTTLDLVLFGWLAATVETQLPDTRSALYGQVLAHEQKYWAATYTDLAGGRADRRLLAEAAACLTLYGPTSLEDADAALTRVAALAEHAQWRRDIARTFEVCLRQRDGERWAIRPDPIGDHHLLSLLTRDTALLARWFTMDLPEETLLYALLVLQRASTDGTWFEHLVRANVSWWPIMIDIATALGGPAEKGLEALAEAPDNPLPLGEISNSLPPQPIGLWRLALLIDERRLKTTTNSNTEQRAALLLRLSMRRSHAGDRVGALAAVDESVDLYRELAQADPAEFQPHLAGSLNNLSVLRAETGDRAGALEAITEAVGLQQQLAQANPAAFAPDLALSLNTLSNRRAQTGDLTGALEAITEAIDLYQQLAQADPAKFLPGRALSLITSSVWRSEAGDRAGALEAITEAVDLYRQLAQADPAEFLPKLCGSLNNLSVLRANAGDRAGALEAMIVAVDLYRQLAQANPAAFAPGLAGSLDNLSIRRAETGDRAGALEASIEAIDLHRQLVQADPAASRSDLARSLGILSIRRAEGGDRPGALDAIAEAVELYRQLLQADPAWFRADLAMSLHNLSNFRAEAGDRAGALEAGTEAVELYRELAQTEPAKFLPDLAVSLNTLSNQRSKAGDQAGALSAITEATDLQQQLAQVDPAVFLPGRAGSLNTLSILRSEAGDHAGALDAITEAVDLCRQLAQTDPIEFLPHLCDSLNNLSVCRAKAGDRPGALDAITEAVDLYRQLAHANPAAFAPGLAASLDKLLIWRGQAEDLFGALEAGTEAVELYRQLAQADSAAFLPSLALSLNNLSVERAKAEDLFGALEAGTEAVELYRQLAQADSVTSLPNLAGSLNNLSGQRAKAGDMAGALEAGTEAVELYRQLAQTDHATFLSKLAT
jgi:hypothetical protein